MKANKKLFDLTKRIIEEVNNTAKDNNCRLLIVMIPEKLQVDNSIWEKLKQKNNLEEKDYDLSKVNKIISTFCKENGMPVLDLLPWFRDYTTKGT